MGIVKKIKSFFATERSTASKTCPSMDNFEFPAALNIILIAFAYDKPTIQTYSWIENLLTKSSRQTNIYRIKDANIGKAELANILKKTISRIEIFCGHGSSECLFGLPGEKDATELAHSVIYDLEMITPGPSSMFAFCCKAADKFGRSFSSEKGNSFIGFKGDIPFPEELYDDLKYIFQTLAKDIIEKGKLEINHELFFIKEIEALIQSSDQYKNPVLAEMWLKEYQKHFKSFI